MSDLQPYSHREAWQRSLEAAGTLYSALTVLSGDPSATLTMLRKALRGGDRRRALLLLTHLHPDYAVELADILAECALSHRDGGTVALIFSRLRPEQVSLVVPAAVWRQLDVTHDEDAYRRLAELLGMLSLKDALRQLSERARASDDAAVREVGEEFAPDEDLADAD